MTELTHWLICRDSTSLRRSPLAVCAGPKNQPPPGRFTGNGSLRSDALPA